MKVDLTRRAFFITGKTEKLDQDIHLPWIVSESIFLDKCTQCKACIEQCPEVIIEKGLGGYPTVNFALGECTFCQECVNACPEDLFDINQASPWNLRLEIDQQCFANRNIICQSCRDACEFQAITFDLKSSVPKPKLDSALCTQCGACVSSCPADAISIIDDCNSKKNSQEVQND